MKSVCVRKFICRLHLNIFIQICKNQHFCSLLCQGLTHNVLLIHMNNINEDTQLQNLNHHYRLSFISLLLINHYACKLKWYFIRYYHNTSFGIFIPQTCMHTSYRCIIIYSAIHQKAHCWQQRHCFFVIVWLSMIYHINAFCYKTLFKKWSVGVFPHYQGRLTYPGDKYQIQWHINVGLIRDACNRPLVKAFVLISFV